MQIAQAFAGFSLGKRIWFRRAMSKKMPMKCPRCPNNSWKEVVKLGVTHRLLKRLFSMITKLCRIWF